MLILRSVNKLFIQRLRLSLCFPQLCSNKSIKDSQNESSTKKETDFEVS
jgi:hypothetical protein